MPALSPSPTPRRSPRRLPGRVVRRGAAAVLGLVVGLLVALPLALHSQAGQQRVCAMVARLVSDAAGGTVEPGVCRVDPWTFSARLGDVRLDLGRLLRGNVTALSAHLDPWALLGGQVRVRSFTLEHPRLEVDLGALPPSPPSSRAPTDPCLILPRALQIDSLRVERAELSVTLPDGTVLLAPRVEAWLQGGGAQWQAETLVDGARVTRPASAPWEALDLKVERVGAKVRLDTEVDRVDVDRLELAALGSLVHLSGSTEHPCGDGRGLWGGRVEAALDRWQPLVPWVPGLGGRLAGELRLEHSVTHGQFDWRAGVDWTLEDGRTTWVTPGTARGRLSARPGELEVQVRRLPVGDGRLWGQARLTLAPPYLLDTQVRIERVRMGEALSRVGVDTLPVDLRLTGQARIQGPLAGPQGVHLVVHTWGKVTDAGVWDRSWQHRREPQARRWVGAKGPVAVDVTAEVTPQATRLQSFAWNSGTSSVDVRGTVWHDTRRGLSLRFDAPALDLAEWGPFGGLSITGRGRVRGQVEGPYSALRIDGTGHADALVVDDWELGSVDFDGRIDTGRQAIDIHRASLRLGRAVATGTGSLDYAADPLRVDAVLETADAPLLDLAGALRRSVPQVDDWSQLVQIPVTGRVLVSGAALTPDAAWDLTLGPSQVAGESFDTGLCRGRLEAARHVRLDRCLLRRGQGLVALRGGVDLASHTYDLRAWSRRLRARDLDWLDSAVSSRIAGGVTVRMGLGGTFEHPLAEGTLDLRDWWLEGQPLASAALRWQWDGDEWTARGDVVSPWPRGTHLSRTDPDAPRPAPPDSMRHALRVRVGMTEGFPYELRVDSDIPSLEGLAPLPEGLHLRLGGRVSAAGLLTDWKASEARVRIDTTQAEWRGTRWNASQTGQLRVREGKAELLPWRWGGPGSRWTLQGTATADALQGGLDGTLDLSAWRLLAGVLPPVPGLDDLKGELRVAARVSGTPQTPEWQAALQLDGGRLAHASLPAPVTEVQGRCEVNAQGIRLQSVSGALGDGRWTLGGHVDWGGPSTGTSTGTDTIGLPAADLVAELASTRLDWQGAPLRVSGALRLGGPAGQWTARGQVRLEDLHWTRDFELERTLVRALELSRRPPTPRVLESAAGAIGLDLGVRVDAARVDNDVLKTALHGDLHLVGSTRHPGLEGSIQIDSGRARIRGQDFTLSGGLLQFNDRTQIRPVFDVHAETQIREYRIQIDASGTRQSTRLSMTSDPVLSETDIVTLLTLGVTSRDFDRAGTTSSIGGVLLDAAYNASGLGSQVQRLLPRQGVLRGASLRVTSAYNEQSGNIEPIAQFEARLSRDRWLLRGQTSLVGGRGRRAQVEWRVDDRRGIQLQWDGDNPNAPSFGDVGGDLRWRWESP